VPFLGTFNGKHTSRVAATTAYAKQYGPVMSMSVNGVKPVVVVNGKLATAELDFPVCLRIICLPPRQATTQYLK
jgi:predicted transcriptional regulator